MEQSNKHLYNTTLSKIKFSIKRFGLLHLITKPIRTILAPLIINFSKKDSFIFNGKHYNYFYHRYNITWANERFVEVPIFKEMIDNEKGTILEVGNVLSHYYPPSWVIIDKFEKSKGVINQDIINFKPGNKFDLIITISTLEHVGYDDNSGNSEEKIIASVENLKNNCLKRKGKLVITVPIGYNPFMDRIIRENKLKLAKESFMKKINGKTWKEVSKEEAMKCSYGKPFLYANALMIGEYIKS